MTPGEVLRKMLDDRGWTQAELATILGRTTANVNEVLQGKRGITPELALSLSAAFQNEPRFWLELETERQLAEAVAPVEDVRRRAALFDLAPVKEMARRGWIKKTSTADELESELQRFFGQVDLSNPPSFDVSMRRSGDIEGDMTPLQRAWCFKARAIAADQVIPPFRPDAISECKGRLKKLTAFAPETRKVAETLNEFGIRFVVVEPLQGSKIDGAAFWIDENKPVIAVSLRHDRIDSFWFTVFHEFSHIENRDAFSVDSELVGDDAAPTAVKSTVERRADADAAEMLIPKDKINSFINRVAPLFSKARIIQFAHSVKIHPGIIVGQLQHRGQIGFHANRELLVKVRDIAISTALVDGWGHTIS